MDLKIHDQNEAGPKFQIRTITVWIRNKCEKKQFPQNLRYEARQTFTCPIIDFLTALIETTFMKNKIKMVAVLQPDLESTKKGSTPQHFSSD